MVEGLKEQYGRVWQRTVCPSHIIFRLRTVLTRYETGAKADNKDKTFCKISRHVLVATSIVPSMHSHVLRGGSAAAVASRRIRSILGAVLGRDGWMWKTHEVKLLNTSAGDLLFIDQNVTQPSSQAELNTMRHSVFIAWRASLSSYMNCQIK